MKNLKYLVPIVSESRLSHMIDDLEEQIEANFSDFRYNNDHLRYDYESAVTQREEGEISDKEYYAILGGILVQSQSILLQEDEEANQYLDNCLSQSDYRDL